MDPKVTIEEIPCGHSHTTEHFDDDGKVVRRDVEIKLKKGFMAEGKTGGFFRRVIEGAKQELKEKGII